MRITLAALVGILCIFTGPAAAQEVSIKGITVANPWARATPGGAKVGVAFFEMKAAPGPGDKLVSAKSPVAGNVEIHNHIMEGGVAKMRRVDGIAVSGGASVALKPGGYHLMLMDLKGPLKEGDRFKLTLGFEKAGEIEVEGNVLSIGAAGPQGAKQQSGGAHKH
jgi:copper(I)-binding protein